MKSTALIKHFLPVLLALGLLPAAASDVFSQSKSGKLVKCRENGKTVYRAKCRAKKKTPPVRPVADIPYSNPNSRIMPSDGTGSGGGLGPGRGQGTGTGSGTGSGSGATNEDKTVPPPPPDRSGTNPLELLSKPVPSYTEEARAANVQGTVTLRVVFQADGTIGGVSVVAGLPHGLNDRAVAAAKLIRFRPATKKGKPITVSKMVTYSFTRY